jgi:uroporphyrinogen-III synthase
MNKHSFIHSVPNETGEKVFISTRPQGNSEELKTLLSGSGYNLQKFPLIKTVPVEPDQDTAFIIDQPNRFSWIVFTSSNGVRYFFKALNVGLPSGIRIAVIGKKTADTVKEYGAIPNFISTSKDSVQFAKKLKEAVLSTSDIVLWPTGKLADNKFIDEIGGYCKLTRLDLYDTVQPVDADDTLKKRIMTGRYSLILFYSPSAVQSFVSMFKEDIEFSKVRAACIGNVSAKACMSSGIKPVVVASEPKSEILISECITYSEHKKK